MTKQETFNFKNKEYIYDKGLFFCKENPPLPQNLTKYYSITDNAVDALFNGYLYASRPIQLNDPFDNYRYLFDTTNIVGDYNSIETIFGDAISEIDKRKCINNPRIFLDYLDAVIFRYLGIISLTDSKNLSPVIWSHYTNNEGFGIVFKTDWLLKTKGFMKPMPAIYVELLEKIKIEPDRAVAQFLCKALIKHNDWRVENEWRIFAVNYMPGSENDQKFYYDKNCIEEIRLAYNFFDLKKLKKVDTDEYIYIEEEELKKKFYSYVERKKIILTWICFDQNEFRYVPQPIQYNYIPEASTIRFKLKNKSNPKFN